MTIRLMMNNYEVLTFNIKGDQIVNINSISCKERLPIILINNLSEENLEKWFRKRSIPEKRENFRQLYKGEFKKKYWDMLLLSHGLNLTDHYWIQKDDEHLHWEEINFFENLFSYDFGNYMINGITSSTHPDWVSPDICTNGNNPKAWRIKNNERFLLKGGSTKNNEECLNEVIVSKYIATLNIPYVSCMESHPAKINGNLFCCCKNFLSPGIELVPAYAITEYRQRDKDIYLYDHLINMCKELEIPHVKKFLNGMLMIDSIFNQKDRHLGNFGFLRDVETLKFIGPAPLYDNGNCLWYNEEIFNRGMEITDKCSKPFAPFFSEQDKYINDHNILKYIDFDYFKYLVMHYYNKSELDPQRAKLITEKVYLRIDTISKEMREIIKENVRKKDVEYEMTM